MLSFLPNLSFFVVEDHILHTTQGLVNRAYIDELWEMALSKTIAALRTHSVCRMPQNMLTYHWEFACWFQVDIYIFGNPYWEIVEVVYLDFWVLQHWACLVNAICNKKQSLTLSIILCLFSSVLCISYTSFSVSTKWRYH